MRTVAGGEDLSFTQIIYNPMSNSFVGPVLNNAISILLRSEKEDRWDYYDSYINEGTGVYQYGSSCKQNKHLGLNDIRTEN